MNPAKLVCIISICGFLPVEAAITQVKDIAKAPQTYNKETKVGFELINDSPDTLWIAVQNGDNIYEENGNNAIKITSPTTATKEQRRLDQFDREFPPKGTIKRLATDINKDSILMVWTQNPGIVKITDIFHPEHVSLKVPHKMYTFTKGKTIYLRWSRHPEPPYFEAEGKLLPQIGGYTTKLDGKKTVISRTNLALSNNVEDKDIRQLPLPR